MNNTTGQTPGITTTSGAADLPEALHRSTAADGKTELFNLPGYPLMVRAVDFNRIHAESEMRRAALLDEMQKATLAAGQATATQPAPVLWVSPEQFANFMDADEAQFGRYVPARKTSAGNFTMPLFAALAPAQPAAQQGAAYAALPTSSYAGRVYEEGFLIGTCPLYTADKMHAFADATHTLRASHAQAPVLWLSPEQLANFVDADEAQFGRYVPARKTCAGNFTMPLFAAPAPLAAEPANADSVQEDAACWHWLAEYLVGTRTDLDDEIVASETVNDLRKLVKAAIKQGEKQ